MSDQRLEKIKLAIEKEGYVLVTTRFLGSKNKLDLICPQSHPWSVTWGNFSNGRRCPTCYNRTVYTLEDVKNIFSNCGYTLKSNSYSNMRQKLLVVCDKGHTCTFCLYNFLKKNVRCSACKGIKKYGLEEAQILFEKEGYTLLSPLPNNSNGKIKVRCSNNHSYETSVTSFIKKGVRCQECQGRNMYTTESVRNLFWEKGYTLITPEYKNMHQKLETNCPNGHIFIITLNEYTKTYLGCLECRGIKKYDLNEVKAIFKKEGYILVSLEYKNRRELLDVICPNDHKIRTSVSRFEYNGARCKFCLPHPPHDMSSVTSFVEKEGYKVISTLYKGAHSKLNLLCPNEHQYVVSFSNFKNCNSRCPECNVHGSSKGEQEVTQWIQQYYSSATKKVFFDDPNNGKKRLELDIYIPELNLGIEFNGLIWHSEKYRMDKNFHVFKMKRANNLGIRLINLFEDEWAEKQSQVKGYLKSVLGKNEIKLFARKTELKEVPKKEAKDFLKTHHIQGSTNFEIAYGLYHNNELMVVMTGGPHHRQGHGNIFVLNRLAFKENVSIAGGSSKLLKALISYAKSRGFVKLLSWSDNRFSEGRVYESIGFTLEDEHGPDYSYIKREKRVSKQSCQKKLLLKKGAQGTMANTERELALTLGLIRIWDCGKKAWSIDLTK